MRTHVKPFMFRFAQLLLPASLMIAAACQPAARTEITPVAATRGPIRAESGMVVSANGLASRIGAQVLESGGNALDAAIATGFALAVTYPTAGNIGGGGFIVIRFPDGSSTAFDFREKAPLDAHAEMFLDENGEYSRELHRNSHLSVGVPGTVAGFAMAHAEYGRAEWEDLVRPSVELAREGFLLTRALAESLRGMLPRAADYPATIKAYSRNGTPYEAGEVFRQRDLARTLERIMLDGHDGFYAGETARLLAEEMRRGGGLITEEDLARYEAKERRPIKGKFRDYTVISMPPPSSGGIALVQMLNILEGYDLVEMGHNSAAYVHHLTEAMRRAYRDRAQLVADMDFVDVPVQLLTSKAYAAEQRANIDAVAATPSSPTDVDMPYESENTTHYSVVDAEGMAVSVTYTLEQGYGSKIVVPGAGFLLNNEMGDFNPKPGFTAPNGMIGTEPNLARPEQRMLSSMTPSILAKDGNLVAIIGSPGGRTIINTVLQVSLNVMEFDMGIQEAVNAPRLHHQWLPDRIRMEFRGTTVDSKRLLEGMGHTIQMGGRQGHAHSIMIDPETGERIGAPDPRDRDSAAIGH